MKSSSIPGIVHHGPTQPKFQPKQKRLKYLYWDCLHGSETHIFDYFVNEDGEIQFHEIEYILK